MRNLRLSLTMAITCCLIVTGSAISQTVELPRQAVPPSHAPRPEAADMTSGMALMGATVLEAGSLYGGSGVTNTVKNSTGNYTVTFDRPISYSTCIFSATPARIASIASVLAVGSNTVTVTTAAAGGAATDKAFHLLAYCWK